MADADPLREYRKAIIEKLEHSLNATKPGAMPRWLSALIGTVLFVFTIIGLTLYVALAAVWTVIIAAFGVTKAYVDCVMIVFWYLKRVAERMSENR